MEQVPQGTEPKLSEYVWRHLNKLYLDINNINTKLTDIYSQLDRLMRAQYTMIVPFEYTFKTTTTVADPGAGSFTFNNASGSLATKLCISQSTTNGLDIQRILQNYTTGDKILFQNEADKTQLIFYQLTSNVIMHTTVWAEMNVVYLQGVESFNNNAKITMTTVVTRSIEIPLV